MKKNKRKTPSVIKKEPTKALALTPEYISTFKFEKWCEYLFDKNNKQTYGNATQAALRAYNTGSYKAATVIGHENLVKLSFVKQGIADNEGFGIGEFIKIAIAKAMKGEYGDWESLGMQLGYFTKNPTIVNPTQNNFNFNFGNMQEAIEASRRERGLTP